MDANEFKTAAGSCIISEDVISAIAATAASETAGVAALAGRGASRAVRILNTEHDTVLDVYVKLYAGTRIQEAAVALQQNVKMAVQSMTGKPVTKVNVHVEGVVPVEKTEE